MALITCRFFSDVLGISTQATVILPQVTEHQIGMPGARATGRLHPTLYLLHGKSDDDTIWTRRTSIERYVSQLNLAVVMPNVHRSYYTDQAVGYRYWTFLVDELPAVMRSFFQLSAERSDNFVAGLSMGGYGAMKCAFARPDMFCAAASLSGGLDIAARDRTDAEWAATFGSAGTSTLRDNDLFELANRVTPSSCPALFQSCGTDDFLYDENVRFRDHITALGLPLDSSDVPGAHTWDVWDREIQRVLRWLPLAS